MSITSAGPVVVEVVGVRAGAVVLLLTVLVSVGFGDAAGAAGVAFIVGDLPQYFEASASTAARSLGWHACPIADTTPGKIFSLFAQTQPTSIAMHPESRSADRRAGSAHLGSPPRGWAFAIVFMPGTTVSAIATRASVDLRKVCIALIKWFEARFEAGKARGGSDGVEKVRWWLKSDENYSWSRSTPYLRTRYRSHPSIPRHWTSVEQKQQRCCFTETSSRAMRAGRREHQYEPSKRTNAVSMTSVGRETAWNVAGHRTGMRPRMPLSQPSVSACSHNRPS